MQGRLEMKVKNKGRAWMEEDLWSADQLSVIWMCWDFTTQWCKNICAPSCLTAWFNICQMKRTKSLKEVFFFSSCAGHWFQSFSNRRWVGGNICCILCFLNCTNKSYGQMEELYFKAVKLLFIEESPAAPRLKNKLFFSKGGFACSVVFKENQCVPFLPLGGAACW